MTMVQGRQWPHGEGAIGMRWRGPRCRRAGGRHGTGDESRGAARAASRPRLSGASGCRRASWVRTSRWASPTAVARPPTTRRTTRSSSSATSTTR
ncbi:MAG: hypothetical protein M0C28_07935 [Candidatus Moduliflexus flocculans]|nr:hypothetical protein [Candidatus Moduliflexus flocculans]